MAALAANAYVSTKGPISVSKFKANAADEYFAGAIVYADTAGGCQVTAAAGDRVLGICRKYHNASAGDEIEVITRGTVVLPIGTNIAAADEGEILVNDGPTSTDNPGDLVAGGDITLATNDAAVGRIKRVTTSRMEVELGGGLTGAVYNATLGSWD